MVCNGATDIGLKRKSNQDCFRIHATKRYFAAVVCDGMGGAKGGSTASRTAASAFMKSIKSSFSNIDRDRVTTGDIDRLLVNALNLANTAVYEKAGTSDSYEGMGTTLVAAVCMGGRAYVVNTGDSRLYAVKDGEITQVTKDHSFVQFLVDSGAISETEAAHHPQKNIILKVVGVSESTECDVFNVTDFDYLLLCTDGLSNVVSKEEMLNVITNGLENSTKLNILIDLANERGGADNITAVVIDGKGQ
ncbi:MAG: Stp1/IreP family PP2C-type Ser/Thr phosphatase [Clostridia bacterium]|nr:Stp1/IreP family PP2C-type Ser/Thr phosphatase [Clostridia bacterium]